ncbi:hypothetical protein CPB85DRAFT_1310117 [Mucidula mucida]|nr:hypothetical protein CPB85DRAFT_1310117 [Mucidula mucida]
MRVDFSVGHVSPKWAKNDVYRCKGALASQWLRSNPKKSGKHRLEARPPTPQSLAHSFSQDARPEA